MVSGPIKLWDVAANAWRYDESKPCLWYDAVTRRCKHYEFRPEICREFGVGGEGCLRMRKEAGVS